MTTEFRKALADNNHHKPDVLRKIIILEVFSKSSQIFRTFNNYLIQTINPLEHLWERCLYRVDHLFNLLKENNIQFDNKDYKSLGILHLIEDVLLKISGILKNLISDVKNNKALSLGLQDSSLYIFADSLEDLCGCFVGRLS